MSSDQNTDITKKKSRTQALKFLTPSVPKTANLNGFKMQYLVSVNSNDMAVHLTRSNCEGFKEVLYI
jgi:hypothetical protein